jgi:hypothetical protein
VDAEQRDEFESLGAIANVAGGKRNQPAIPTITSALRKKPGITLVIGVKAPLSGRFTFTTCRFLSG